MELPDLHILLYAKIGAALLGLFVAYIVIRTIYKRATIRRLAHELNCLPPPKVYTIDPILGLDVFLDILKTIKEHKTLERSYRRFEEMKANTIIVPLLINKAVFTCEPENVKTVLATNFEDYGLEKLRKIAVPFVGRGIFTTDGAEWQHSRNLLKPMFTRTMLADVSVFELHVDRLLGHIPYDGTQVDLQSLFFQLTIDVASHVMIGSSTNLQVQSSGTSSSEFAAAFQNCLNYFGTDPGLSAFLPTPKARRFKRNCRIVNAHIDKYIQRAYEETSDPLFTPKSPGADPNRNILLYDLVWQGVPKEKIRSEILNTILAGRDTTASTLSDLWFELSKNSAIFAQLHKEVHTLCPPGTEITFDLLKTMPYLRALLNECLRIHPVVPENARMANKHTTLPVGGGPDGKSPIFVPKGGLVVYSPYVMHRRADLWEDPNTFTPERWLDTEEKKGVRPGWSFLPFNGGPRVCIGQQFALLLVSYVTVRMVQGMKEDGLESRDPEEWKENVTVTCTGLNGCKVAITGKDESKEGVVEQA